MEIHEPARLTRIRAAVAAHDIPLPLGTIGNGPNEGLCLHCADFEQHEEPARHSNAPAGYCLGCGGPLNQKETHVTTTAARWYPNMPPALDGETDEQYTDRLTGADRTGRRPYDHSRNRQCSIGYHEECSDRSNSGDCGCPCHEERRNAERLVDDWNSRYPVGTPVTLPNASDEPPTRTTGPAQTEPIYNRTDSWPVVALEGFPHPVRMSWLKPEVAR